MSTLALTFGPTGGHLIPAILVAREWRKLHGGEVKLFSTVSADHPLLSDQDVSYEQIQFQPWVGSTFRRLFGLKDVIKIYPRLRQSLRTVDAILGLGGYSSVPVILAARELGIPVFIQEQNRIFGRANELFISDSFKTFFGLPPVDTVNTSNGVVLGNPVRIQGAIEEPWFTESPLLVVFGGSQGSRDLSEILKTAGDELINKGWHIFYLTGKYGKDLADDFPSDSFRQEKTSWQLPGILGQADCAWCRAGAGTISELIHYDVPAILFPYPHAADDHQKENALWSADHGPVEVVHDYQRGKQGIVNKTMDLFETNQTYQIPWDLNKRPEQIIVEEIHRWIG